jgi:DNA repair protein RadC
MYTLQSRPYVIRDQPGPALTPEERIRQQSSLALTVAELLQVILGESLASSLNIAEYGSSQLTTVRTIQDVQQRWPLSDEDAARLLAAVDLGRRLFAPANGSLATIRGIEDVYQAYRSMANLSKEEIRVLLINSRYQLIHEETVAVGSLNELTLQPRDIFQSAVERRVSAVILVHNHPSGDPTPSEADRAVTRRLTEAGKLLGIELLDHVIIGHDSYQSCMDRDENENT